MKRILSTALLLCLVISFLTPLPGAASAEEFDAAALFVPIDGPDDSGYDGEYAWFPAPVMNLSQLAYENYSHGSQNAIDILPGGRVFAPFTGKIAYKDANWGYVTLQSLGKVYWPDGTYDYMTVGFMHDENISDLVVGQVISQGTYFYDAGGQGQLSDGSYSPNAYGDHVHITVHKGTVTRGYPYGTGDRFAFNALYINPQRTTSIVNKGKAKNPVLNGAPSDYSNLWTTLPSASSFYLDINGRQLSGFGVGEYTDKSDIEDWGTCDVYINGILDADDVTDYYKQWPNGTSYFISDIRATGLNEVDDSMEDLSGVIQNSDKEVRLIFHQIKLTSDTNPIYLTVNDGAWVNLSTTTGSQVDEIIIDVLDPSIARVETNTVMEYTSGGWLYLSGISQGDTRLCISYVKDYYADVLYVPVHVSGLGYDRYLTLSDWDIELIGDVSGYCFPKTITATCPGNYPYSYYLQYQLGNDDLFYVNFGDWYDNNIDIELMAKYPAQEGSTWMWIGLYDSDTDALVDSATIYVTVADPYNIWLNGVYELHRFTNGMWSGKVLTNYFGNVEQRNESGAIPFAKQLWVFERQEDKSYIIRSLYDNTYLVPDGNYNEAGCNVCTTDSYPSSRAQRWAIKAHPDGGYYLCLATINDLVLDIYDGSMDNGVNAQLWWENGTDAQRFGFDYWGSEISVPKEAFTPSTPYLWTSVDHARRSAYIGWTDSPMITERGAFDTRAYEFELWDLTTDTLIEYALLSDTYYDFQNAESGHSYGAWLRAVNTEFDYSRVPYTASGWTYVDFSIAENPFVDVKEGKYYYDPVLWAYFHDPQITNGTDDTHFSPNKTCTRGQVLTFLWNAMGQPEPNLNDNPFVDVKLGKYYTKAVLWAYQSGITNGVDDTHFKPNGDCTRGQVVTFLWKAMDFPDPQSSYNPFTDVKPGKFYYNAVLWAVERGITNGTSATTFSPNKTCTRGQVVTFLYNALAG